MTATNVARNLFDRPEDLKAYVDSAGSSPEALSAIRDYAAFSLRKAAVKDGLLSPAKHQQWVNDHGYALRQFPDLAEKFASARLAQTTLDDAVAAQKEALSEFQTTAVRRLLADHDPVQVVGKALGSPGEFAALATQASNDPAALAGLKRAAVEFMLGKAKSTAEAGTSGVEQIKADALQRFYLNNRRTLSSLFDGDELDNIGRVAADLRQANRSIVALKIPGGSNTPQDTAGRAMSVLAKVLREYGGKVVGATTGSAAGPVGSAAGFLAGAAWDAMRAARADSVEKALTEMMLDPKMAAVWLAKVPATSDVAATEAFARRLRAVTANQVVQAIDGEARQKNRAAGGLFTTGAPP